MATPAFPYTLQCSVRRQIRLGTRTEAARCRAGGIASPQRPPPVSIAQAADAARAAPPSLLPSLPAQQGDAERRHGAHALAAICCVCQLLSISQQSRCMQLLLMGYAVHVWSSIPPAHSSDAQHVRAFQLSPFASTQLLLQKPMASCQRGPHLMEDCPPKRASARSERPRVSVFSARVRRRAAQNGAPANSEQGAARAGPQEIPGRPAIHPMPAHPLALLRELVGHITVRSAGRTHTNTGEYRPLQASPCARRRV